MRSEEMSELLNKISAYDVINIALPGIALVAFNNAFFAGGALAANDFLTAVGVCFVAGVVASRVGSVVVEPIVVALGGLKRGSYAEYLRAVERNGKIEGLRAVSNMYRSLAGAALVCLAELVLEPILSQLGDVSLPLCCVALLALFAISWAKQEAYINKRVEMFGGEKGNEQD